MIIAVCIKQVVTREWQVRVNDAKTWVRDEDASWELNEPDAYALEEALRLREKHGGEVVVVSAGPARVTQVLREALARGADRAIHVDGDHLATADAFTAADALAAALKDRKKSIWSSRACSPTTRASRRSASCWPRSSACALDDHHGSAGRQVEQTLRVKRELEGGWFQWIAMPLPAVLTIQSGINQLRYATLKGIMAAKKKEIRAVPAPPAPPARQRITAVYMPEKAKQTRMIGGSAGGGRGELVRVLREDARVF